METAESKLVKIDRRGSTIREQDYNGDIGNYRVTLDFKNRFGIDFHASIHCCPTRRTKSLVNGCDLKTVKETSHANGLYMQVFAMYTEVIRGCTGQWFTHETEKEIFSIQERDDLTRPVHQWRHVLTLIYRATNVKLDMIDDDTIQIIE